MPFHGGTIKVGILTDALKKSGISMGDFLDSP